MSFDTTMFVEGERQLGQHTVRIARHSEAGWSPTIPPLEITVTNRRLFIRPQVRKAYQPASIPKDYVTHVREVELGMLHGLAISLKTGHTLYNFIDKEHGDKLMEDIRAMLLPTPHFKFDEKVVEADIQRLIDFINRM